MATQQNERQASNSGSKPTARAQGWKQAKGQNLFPPPKALPEYATKNLPPLPARSSSSSLYDSEEGSRRPTPSHLQANSAHRDDRLSTSFSGALDENALAMVRPPSVATDLPYRQSGQRQDIASPQPRHPGHKILTVKTHGDMEVSPILTPPSGRFTYQQYTVSPLTPDGSTQGYDETISEPDRASYINSQHWTQDAANPGQLIRRRSSSQWEDIPPRQSSLGFQPLPVRPGSSSKSQGGGKPAFRYSDPGSPAEASTASRRFDTPASSVQASDGPDKGAPRTQSDGGGASLSDAEPQPARGGSQEDIITSPYSRWTKGYGPNGASPSPKISFAVQDTPGSSARPGADSKPKPNALKLADGHSTDEYVRTPYPDNAPKSGWDHEEEEEKPKRSSWGRSQPRGKQEGPRPRVVGKLVSRVKNAGGDVISKLSFTSEESKREKRAEELRGKIQHQGLHRVEKQEESNMF